MPPEVPSGAQKHRFYGKIPGIFLPVDLPLFLRASTCRTFLEIKIWYGYVNQQHSKYLCRVERLHDQKQYMSFATVLFLIPENVYGHLLK